MQKSEATRSPDVTQRTLFLLEEVSRKRGLFEKEQQAAGPASPGVSRQVCSLITHNPLFIFLYQMCHQCMHCYPQHVLIISLLVVTIRNLGASHQECRTASTAGSARPANPDLHTVLQ